VSAIREALGASDGGVLQIPLSYHGAAFKWVRSPSILHPSDEAQAVVGDSLIAIPSSRLGPQAPAPPPPTPQTTVTALILGLSPIDSI